MDVLAELTEKWIAITPFAGLPHVYLFDHKDDYAMKGTDAFYQGRIYLQSISSMLPVLALDPESWDSVLDICAAPGSKTTQMAMMMGNIGKITALEQNPIRYEKLIHNCALQWATIVEGKRMDAKVYLDPLGITKFNKILLDAQCSAEGRISLSNDKTYGFWSLENIKKKAEVQYDLLSRAITRLEKWGILVYSTCTLAPEENEWVITRVLAENKNITLESIDIGLGEKSWRREGITTFGSQKYSEEMKKAVRILPSEETEGFFIAKIAKI
jgi:16S rRNA C967 or C1407 C5-methylase (RsmB/RsmF family)